MPRITEATVAEHSARKRSELVTAAAELLAEGGPIAVTPTAVATKAGLARSSLYQYFSSSGALVGVAVEEVFRQVAEAIETALAGADGPAQRLHAYLNVSFDAALSGHQPLSAYTSVDLPPECLERVQELHRQMVTPLLESLRGLGVDDAMGNAVLINGVVSAAAGQAQRGEPAKRARDRMHEFIASAIA